MFTFEKETVLPTSDPKSPFFINLPSHDSRPIDDLISFFKYWKHLIKSLIFYFREIGLFKEFEANLNYQLINSIQFPGFKDLPSKMINRLDSAVSPTTSQSSTPVKELSRTLSNTSVSTVYTSSSTNAASVPTGEKRPNLWKTKSNNSFLKDNGSTHKRNMSLNSISSKNLLPQKAINSPPSHQYQNDIKIPPKCFPDNSLFNNLPPLLINHHSQLYQSQIKLYRELINKLIPRLETLLKNLSIKIKEIKSSLKNESFANPDLIKEISETGKILNSYMNSIERYSAPKPVLKKHVDYEDNDEDDKGELDDPFLIKLRVDYQIKYQLIKENYMFASYVNLQNISKDLFTYVLKELNSIVDKFGKLVNQESVYLSNNEALVNFYLNLKKNVSTSSNTEWEYFISNNPNFLNTYKDTSISLKKTIRSFKGLVIPYSGSIHNKCIRFGVIYKKSKLLKNYCRFYYVLTCNYLHEFKVENEANNHMKKREKDKIGGFIGYDDIPMKSYNLNDYFLKIKDSNDLKFLLIKSSNSNKKYTFKCLNNDEYSQWCGDLSELLKFGKNHLERFNLVENKIRLREEQVKKEQPKLKEKEVTIDIDAEKKPKDATKQLQLNLANLHVNHPLSKEQSLSGIFTPRINTPNPKSSNENNPFDEIFLNEIPLSSNLSSPNISSPNLSPSETSISQNSSNLSHQHQHENYLKIQQQFLKQQQELLNLKIKEQVLQQQKSALTKFSSFDEPPSFINQASRNSSDESINSLINQSASNIQKLLNTNKELINQSHQKKPALFTLNDEDSSDKMNSDISNSGTNSKANSSNELPTVLISSDY